MRAFLPLVAVLLLASPAVADIDVRVDKPLYNLGDFVRASYLVTSDSDFSGITRLSLTCSDYGLEFYALPTSLSAGESQAVQVPGLRLSEAASGRCFVDASVSSFDSNLSYSDSSAVFNVTGDMGVSVELADASIDPGDELVVDGSVAKTHSLRGSASLDFLGRAYISNVVNNSFAYAIRLPSDMSSGRHVLYFAVNDSFGNSGAASAEFSVTAFPTSLGIVLSNSTALPGTSLQASVSLLDQGSDSMERSVSISLYDEAGKVFLYGSNTTPAVFSLDLPSGTPPGTYAVEASSAGIVARESLVVASVEEVSAAFDDRFLTISNTGNVPYRDVLLVNLSGAKGTHSVSQGLDLAPGESAVIDLYREVPEDDYEISVPQVPGSPTYSAHLLDERSPVKKASDFVGITGNLVGEPGAFNAKTLLAPVVLIALAASVLLFYSRRKQPAYDSEDEPVVIRRDEAQPSQPSSQKDLSRDDAAVQQFMENMNRDKPFR